jgi:hypothetical protein
MPPQTKIPILAGASWLKARAGKAQEVHITSLCGWPPHHDPLKPDAPLAKVARDVSAFMMNL